MAVSGVLVHGVEGHATGLHGSCPGVHDVLWDVKSASLEKPRTCRFDMISPASCCS